MLSTWYDITDHVICILIILRVFPFWLAACDNGDVRLVGGSTETQGRVEICIGGTWGTVANYGWNVAACNVVCKQLFDQDRLTGANIVNYCATSLLS